MTEQQQLYNEHKYAKVNATYLNIYFIYKNCF